MLNESFFSCCQQDDSTPKKQSLYLMFDAQHESPVKSPPIRLSDSTTPCSGYVTASKLSNGKGCQGNGLPSQHVHGQFFLSLPLCCRVVCLKINSHLCTPMIENRGQRYRSFIMGRNKDMYFSFIFLLNRVTVATASLDYGFLLNSFFLRYGGHFHVNLEIS